GAPAPGPSPGPGNAPARARRDPRSGPGLLQGPRLSSVLVPGPGLSLGVAARLAAATAQSDDHAAGRPGGGAVIGRSRVPGSRRADFPQAAGRGRRPRTQTSPGSAMTL